MFGGSLSMWIYTVCYDGREGGRENLVGQICSVGLA